MNDSKYMGFSEFDKRVHKLLNDIHLLKVDIKLLQNRMHFLETHTIDPTVRGKPFPQSIDAPVKNLP